ncbi:Transcriptional adapter 2-alpha [Exaiptasia diaphana]|nr:Transcriptional adapter 2-alpha [Exaiptasia diaphana]
MYYHIVSKSLPSLAEIFYDAKPKLEQEAQEIEVLYQLIRRLDIYRDLELTHDRSIHGSYPLPGLGLYDSIEALAKYALNHVPETPRILGKKQSKKGAAVFEKLKKKHEEDLGKRKLVDDVLIHIRDQKVCQAWLQRQALLECGKSLAPIPLPSLGRRPAARLDLNGTPGVELLSLEEREWS